MKKIRVILCALCAFLIAFAFLPQTVVTAEPADARCVYVGGYPIGISIDVGGLLVESVTGVETEYGMAAVEGLKKGDIIKKINGVGVDSVDDISEMLTTEKTNVELLRNGSALNVEITPIVEAFSQKPRLGVKIKDVIYGVGTVTLVRQDGTFSALGHEISDESGTRIPFCGGRIHACKILGVKRGHKNSAGALSASVAPDRVFGSVECNNSFGIAGKYESDYDKSELVPVASRDEVKIGAAKIKTCVGGRSEYYDIEIIKAVKQSGRKEKGMVLRVTDKRLLDITGGVVRGMSGSPIIQNGKLVGAVTHVFLNDFTKGYGVYADCLN